MAKLIKRSAEEEAFLAEYEVEAFERSSVTVDVVVITAIDGHLRAVLYRRPNAPEKGAWSLPGGFLREDETLHRTAERVLERRAGLSEGFFFEQLYTFGAPDRDPRTRVVTVAYYALVEPGRLQERLAEGEQADVQLATLTVPWLGEQAGPIEAADAKGKKLRLAFDHAGILGMAVRRLRGKLMYTSIAYRLLPETFTLRELQQVHEAILGEALNKRSFRRRLLASGEIEPTGKLEEGTDFRPAQLYRAVLGW